MSDFYEPVQGLAGAPVLTGRWATVWSQSPFLIVLDGDTEPLPMTPDSLIAAPAAGRRVWVQLCGRSVVVIGVSGGV